MLAGVLSVVLPFRDAAATLATAVTSTLSDLGARGELLLVNDGSTDGSAELAASIARKDARVRLVASGGRGIAAALAEGIAAARGDLVARMDADDVLLPGRIGAQVAALEADARLAVVGCRVRVEGLGADVGEGLRRYVAWQNALLTPEDHARDRFVESTLCHPATMLRKSAVLAVGGYRDVPWPEDWDLWLRLLAEGFRIAKVPHEGLVWRHRAGRETFSSARCSEEALRRARAHHLARWLGPERSPLVVWGAGRTGRRLARALEAEGRCADAFVDIDPRKIGRTARGAPIVRPEALVRGGGMVVVAVGAQGARMEVRAHLASRGFEDVSDFICAA
jgi:GT2 family glycosyltransferase